MNRATDEGLQVFDPKINPRRYLWISNASAEPIQEPNLSNFNSSSFVLPQLRDTVELPHFIRRKELVGQLSELVFPDLKILSFHEKISDYMHQRLIVFDKDRVLIDEILIKHIQKLQPESFFMVGNYLFYIRNKNEIVSYLV
ncbi:MAG: hypothetical protein FJY21_11615 [Bacteroidetes bacterium]|nr:hypothetical protein [Bacteroidota bacterium]